MKRYLKSVLLVVGVIIMFAACTNNDNSVTDVSDETDRQQAMVDLRNSLSQFSDNFESDLVLPQGRGFWKILKADASGAISGSKWGWWGALGGAAVFSVCEYFINKTEITTKEPITVDPQQIGLPADCIEVITGEMHNKIVENVINKYPNLLDLNIDQVTEIVLNETAIVSGDTGLNVRNNATFKAEIKNVEKVVKDGKCISEEVVKLHPEFAHEFELIDIYTSKLPYLSTEKAEEYTFNVVEIIQNSEITEASKVNIIRGVVTGMNSNNIWAY